jgi:ribose transport system substrate-binding protein
MPATTSTPRRVRRLRRTVTAALALGSASALLAGCSGAASGGDAAASGSSSEENLRIVYIAALINDSFFITGKCGAEAAAEEGGATLQFQGPTSNSATEEIQAFSAAAATNPDAMLVAPFANAGFSNTVKSLMEKGAPVWATGQTLEPAEAYGTTITDYLTSAEQLKDIIGDLSGGEGTVGLIANNTGNKTDSDRYTQLVPELEEAYPDLDVLDPEYTENSSAKAATAASALIQAHPDMKVIYATSGPEAAGVASAIKAAGKTDTVKLVSFDSSPDQIELLQNGELAATVGQSPYQAAYIGTQKVIEWVRDNPDGGVVPATDEITATPTMLLTPENVDTEEAQEYQYMTSCD